MCTINAGHVAFGVGKHLCPGNRLGLAEAEEAIIALLTTFRFPGGHFCHHRACQQGRPVPTSGGTATGQGTQESGCPCCVRRPTIALGCPMGRLQWADLQSMQTLVSLPVVVVGGEVCSS